MRIPTLAATMVVAAAVIALPGAANATTPIVGNDSVQTDVETEKEFNVLTNDSNPDVGESLTVISTTDPANGTAVCAADGACSYTPDALWTGGTDTFTYTVSDGGTVPETNTATVTVSVFDVDSIANLITQPGTNISASSVRWPDEKVDIATIVRNPSGAGLQGVEVTLFAKPSGGEYAAIHTGTTNASGRVTVTNVQPETRTSYQWRTTGSNSTPRSLGVTPSLTVDYSTKRVSVGDTLTVAGASAPASEGQTAVLEKLSSTGTWGAVDSQPLVAGEYSFAITPEVSRSDTYRVTVDGTDWGRNDVVSATGKIKAYQAEIADVEPATTNEFVKITNTGNVALQLKNWELSDANSTVTLPRFSVAKAATVRVYSGNGSNSVSRIYLDGPQNWNNDEGTIALTDTNEFEIDSFTYPAVVAP